MGTSATVAKSPVRFGVFELDLDAGELRKNGSKVHLEGQPIQILQVLLERPGEVVTREELRARLWPAETFVDFDHSINAAINRLREALDDSAESPRYIQPLPRRGYRFICPVNGAAAAEALPPGRSRGWRSRWILVSAGILATLAGFGLVLRARSRASTPPQAVIHSVAVLPLNNLSGDAGQEYFADGMSDALITELGKVRALRVISWQSVVRYKHTTKPLPEIARELKVDAVIEGSVLRSGDELRIDVQLVQADPEQHLWAESFVRTTADVLQLQSEVATAVAHATRVEITPEEKARLARAGRVNPEAYVAWLRGREMYARFDDEWLDEAVTYLQRSIQLDPTYAPPYATLAEVYSTDMRYSYAELEPRATAAAAKALELDENLPEAHAAQAYVDMRFRYDWASAERHIKRAIELDPNSADAYETYGYYLTLMGRSDESIAAYRHALDLDPLSFLPNERLGWALSKARRYDEAIAHLEELRRREPTMFMTNYTLIFAYAFKGRSQEALAGVATSERKSGSRQWPARFDYGWIIATYGSRQESEQLLQEMTAYSQQHYLDPCFVAFTYAGRGDKDKAIEWLERGYRQHARFMIYLRIQREVDNLRSDPRFQDLLRRMAFPPAPERHTGL